MAVTYDGVELNDFCFLFHVIESSLVILKPLLTIGGIHGLNIIC
jgi:hypothetical protein